MKRLIFGIIICLVLQRCNTPSHQFEKGNVYYYLNGKDSNFVLITDIVVDAKFKIINLSPIIHVDVNKPQKGYLIMKRIPGDENDILWTSATQVDYNSFKNLTGGLIFHKKITLNKNIRTGMALAAGDLTQFKFTDKVIRNSGSEFIPLDLLR